MTAGRRSHRAKRTWGDACKELVVVSLTRQFAIRSL